MAGFAHRPVLAPSIDEINADAACLRPLTYEALTALRARCASALAIIESAQITAAVASAVSENRGRPDPAPNRTLNADEIAAELGVKRRWVFRHVKRLPFVRRVSRKHLVCSEAGIRRYLAARKA